MAPEQTTAEPATAATYPPPPWHLGGRMHLSLWRVPADALPVEVATSAPPGTAPVVVGGETLVGTAFVRYEPGGVLHYDELIAAVLVHARGRPRITIPHIWVDHLGSLRGGRELWAIPKRLARFEHRVTARTVRCRAATDDGVVAELVTVRSTRLPGWWPLRLRTAQQLDGVVRTTSVRSSAQLALARSRWSFPADGPLGYLADRPAVGHLDLERFRLSFGLPRRRRLLPA
jgi:hypothetical protein